MHITERFSQISGKYYNTIITNAKLAGEGYEQEKEDIEWAIASVISTAQLSHDEDLIRESAEQNLRPEIEQIIGWNEQIEKHYAELVQALINIVEEKDVELVSANQDLGIATAEKKTAPQISAQLLDTLVQILESRGEEDEQDREDIEWAIASVISTAQLSHDEDLIRESAEQNLRPEIQRIVGWNEQIEKYYTSFVQDLIISLSPEQATTAKPKDASLTAVNELGKIEQAAKAAEPKLLESLKSVTDIIYKTSEGKTKTITADAKLVRANSSDVKSKGLDDDDAAKVTITSNGDLDFLMDTIVSSSIEHMGPAQPVAKLIYENKINPQSVMRDFPEEKVRKAILRLYGLVHLDKEYYEESLGYARKLIVMDDAEILKTMQQYTTQALKAYIDGLRMPSEKFYRLMQEALVEMQKLEYHSAIKSYERALQILKEDNPDNIHIWKGHLHNNLGVSYFVLGMMSDALEHYKQSLKARQEAYPNGHGEIAITHNNIAKAYMADSKFEEGIKHFTEELNIRRKLGDSKRSLVLSQLHLCDLYNALGKTEEARNMHLAAEADAREDPEMILHCLFWSFAKGLNPIYREEAKKRAKEQLMLLESNQKDSAELLKVYRFAQRFYATFERDLERVVWYMEKTITALRDKISILEKESKDSIELDALKMHLIQELLNKGTVQVLLYQQDRKKYPIEDAEKTFADPYIHKLPFAILAAQNNLAVCKLCKNADAEVIKICTKLLKNPKLKEYPILEQSVYKNLSQAHMRIGLRIIPLHDDHESARSEHLGNAKVYIEERLKRMPDTETLYEKALLEVVDGEYGTACETMEKLGAFGPLLYPILNLFRYCAQKDTLTDFANIEEYQTTLQNGSIACKLMEAQGLLKSMIPTKDADIERSLREVAGLHACNSASSILKAEAAQVRLQLNL